MTASLKLSSLDRLLVFAPHPDDETISSGVLIQSALAAGATVRIVFVTDGDNNPWPQRWLERRWTIGTEARARWGLRRRSEALAALAVLGLHDVEQIRFLGWADQGLTDCLMRDDAAVTTLGAEIAGFAPTHVAMPSLRDRHPDHSALRVMLELALLRSGTECLRLGYVVHGEKSTLAHLVPSAGALFQQRKQEALEAHASQVALSRGRLLGLATRMESFEVGGATAPAPPDNAATVSIPHRRGSLRRHELLLVIATRNDTVRFRVPVDAHGTDAEQLAATRAPAITQEATCVDVALPRLSAPLLAVYAKIDRAGPRLVIFDKEPWHDAGELPESITAIKRQAAASLS